MQYRIQIPWIRIKRWNILNLQDLPIFSLFVHFSQKETEEAN